VFLAKASTGNLVVKCNRAALRLLIAREFLLVGKYGLATVQIFWRASRASRQTLLVTAMIISSLTLPAYPQAFGKRAADTGSPPAEDHLKVDEKGLQGRTRVNTCP
jgi:hypothetical protein